MIQEYHFPGDPTNFLVEVSSGFGTRFDEFKEFCESHFGTDAWYSESYVWTYRFYFVDSKDAVMFYLKFGNKK